MFQAIHYFYGYFQTADNIDERIVFSVPTGAFGNLFAGYLAREMGLPVASFICANNRNATVHRILETNIFSRKKLKQTPSNAIDIALPYNYWRFLYFVSGQNSKAINKWMSEYQDRGYVEFTDSMMKGIRHGFLSVAVSDRDTLITIAETYRKTGGYLLDPHGAVAVAAARALISTFDSGTKVISLLTAHPAKFPDITRRALKLDGNLPPTALHDSIEKVKDQFQQLRLCDCSKLQVALIYGLAQESTKKNKLYGSIR
jgi:threonine synthase